MADQLKITITSDNAAIIQLTKDLNAGLLTVQEYAKRVREIKNSSIVGSQGLMDLKNIQAQVAQQTQTATGAMMSNYFKLGESLRSLQQNFLMISAAAAAFVAAFASAEKAARLELLRSTMASMASKEGVDFAKILDEIKQKTHGVLSEAEMLQGAMRLSLLDVGWAKIPEIMDVAEKRSKLLGISFEETLNMIERAAMGNTRALRGLLIPVTVEESHKRFADQLGVQVDLLNERGKRQAILNTIMEESAKQNLSVNEKAAEEVDLYERLKATIADLVIAFGKLIGVFSPIVSGITSVVTFLRLSIEEITNLALAGWNVIKFNWSEATRYTDLAKKNAKELRDALGFDGAPTFTGGSSGTWESNTEKIKQNASAFIDKEKATKAATKAELDHIKAIQEHNKALDEWETKQEKQHSAFVKAMDYRDKKLAYAQQKRNKIGGGFIEDAETPMAEAIKEMKKEFEGSAIKVAAFKDVVSGTTSALSNAFQGLIKGTMSAKDAVLGFADVLLKTAADAGAKTLMGGILSWLKLGTGGSIQYAASGGNFGPGSKVIVGERGPEMLLIGNRGTQVIPNINSITQNARYGGGGSQQINIAPFIKTIPIIDSQGLSIQVQIGNRQRGPITF